MWYNEKGPKHEVVLSSRVRLARNVKKLPFVNKMTSAQQKESIELAREAFKLVENKVGSDLDFFDVSSMNEVDKTALAERHLISAGLLDPGAKRGLLLSKEQNISIMINEEDHIRIQCMAAGLDLNSCLDLANRVDDMLEKTIEYGFDNTIGYLTCCPTNVGTGMRASVMIHLPALVMTGMIDKIVTAVAKLGMTVRGIFGEGSQAIGNIFQISNQVTLGYSEKEILEKLKEIIAEVIVKEMEARSAIYSTNKYEIEDKIMRSYGVLANAVVLPSAEFMSLVSDVRLGINMGIIKNTDSSIINELINEALPANLTQKFGIATEKERDLKRAEVVRKRLEEHRNSSM